MNPKRPTGFRLAAHLETLAAWCIYGNYAGRFYAKQH